MSAIPFLLALAFAVAVAGGEAHAADCNGNPCYAEWTQRPGQNDVSFRADMQVSHIYAYPNNECPQERTVQGMWMNLPDGMRTDIEQWIELGTTTGGFTQYPSTTAKCLTNIHAYHAYQFEVSVGQKYRERYLDRQLEPGTSSRCTYRRPPATGISGSTSPYS